MLSGQFALLEMAKYLKTIYPSGHTVGDAVPMAPVSWLSLMWCCIGAAKLTQIDLGGDVTYVTGKLTQVRIWMKKLVLMNLEDLSDLNGGPFTASLFLYLRHFI